MLVERKVHMVQSIVGVDKPVYSAVNIKITKPEVNATKSNNLSVINDNGVYNAVKIDIDNPSINTEPKIYDYPESNEIMTYDKLNTSSVALPQGFPVVSYYATSVIVPESPKEISETKDEVQVPQPNYTTLEAEKGEAVKEEKVQDVQPDFVQQEAEKKTPEIVPSEPIKPTVDIALVKSNLESDDFDIQARQIEEIAGVSLDNPAEAIPYIVKDVFADLIEIIRRDTSNMAAPSEKQIEIRKQIMANVIAEEIAKEQNKPISLPYNISESDIAMATEITPMEQAERNKEYAIYALSILSKVYIDEIQKETGNVVPFTDIPGLSDIVDELRFNPNPSVKVAALDGLRYIRRPEYKNELGTIFSIAQSDDNPRVAAIAAKSLEIINKE